jgi:DNA-binding CsgD family transcriptional regulator/tetratricopeptide (TPR) repeat protein
VGGEGSLSQTAVTGLLERVDELAAVDAAIEAAKDGTGRFVVIEGPAGIGKTSILVEGRTRAAGSGLSVLQARGSELESAFSFGVVRQLFEAPLAHRSAEERSALLGGAAAQAARLFGRGGEDAETAQEDPFALLHGLYWLAANLSDEQPLLLAIDDLQWSDASSLRWFAYLTRRVEGMPVAVVATSRPVGEEQPVLDELLVDPVVLAVRPSALSVPSVAALVRADLGADADEAFVASCHRATGGNPLLLRELLRSLAAEEVTPVAASVSVVERLAPDAVTRSVRVRLVRLPEEATRLARAVAVLGDRADRDLAAVIAGLDRREVAPAAAALAGVDLLRPEPPFSFVHPLVRNAVYEGIPLPEREAAHAGAAEVLMEFGAAAEQIAAQILLAPPESVEDGVAVLRDAARAASAEGGLESAVSYLQRALDEPLTSDERGELLLELAAYEANTGAPKVIPHLREALASLSNSERQAEAALALGHELYWSGDERQGVDVLERALEERPNLGVELRTRLEAELAVNATRVASQYERARELLAAVDVSLDDGPGARLLLAGRAYHEAASGAGDADSAADAALAALEAMSHEERAQNYTGGVYTLLRTDRFDDGIRVLDATISDARRRGAVFHFSSLSITRAVFHYARGALNDAEADGRAAFETLPHRNVWFAASVHGWLAQILVERGNVDEAAALIDSIEPTVAPEAFARAVVVRGWTLVDAARGDHRAALAHAHELGAVLASFGHTNPSASYPAWRTLAALEHHALGETAEALTLAREEVALARDWGVPSTLGRALRINGVIQSGEDGIELLREAVTVLTPSPARLEHAYALADLGSALRRANHRSEARDPLKEALDFAQRSGAVLLAGQAHEELIATGARPRRVIRSGAASLTPSERRIATMVAEGLSNRDIAQALFVTLRTVEMHLSNVFRKLQISSRTQVAAALAADMPDPGVASEG